MLRATLRFLAGGPYFKFLKETKNHPSLKKLSGAQRSNAVRKMFYAQSPAQRASLKARTNSYSKAPGSNLKGKLAATKGNAGNKLKQVKQAVKGKKK